MARSSSAFTIGTFNVNNLFSRFNFELEAEVEKLKPGKLSIQKIRSVVRGLGRQTSYQGAALTRKPPKDRKRIGERIREMNLDVLCLQEVEDIETLRYFLSNELKTPIYPHYTLVEGNDNRLIDLAIVSKYPLGAVTSWQHATHPDKPKDKVFSRDLLQVEILSKDRSNLLLTVFNNHLKSHFVPFTENQAQGTREANALRRRQAEAVAAIAGANFSPRDPYVVLGDMNDDIDSEFLAPLVSSNKLRLVNGLAKPTESQQVPLDAAKPSTTAWTYRHKASSQPANYSLFDQIWLSPTLANRQTGAFINRRTKLTRDGSDHDPAWVELRLGKN